MLTDCGWEKEALHLSRKYAYHHDYLRLLIEYERDFQTAVDYIHSLAFHDAEAMIQEFGRVLLDEVPQPTTQLCIELCTDYQQTSVSRFYSPEPQQELALSPLQSLGSSKLELRNCTIKDLSPLAKMPNLSELNLYGASVKDFSPLAGCAKLKSLTYYAVDGADFSTLGALKQIVELKGGLTKLDNISFVSELPALRVFDLFAEYVTDYTPLASSKVEDLQIWKMRVPVGDLGAVGKTRTLKELKLWSVDGATNSAALAGLTELQKFTITSEYNKKNGGPFDMACAKGWGKLKEMSITGTRIVNAGNMAALTSMERLILVKVNVEGEPFSLSGLAKLTRLQSVRINDSQVADFEALAGCTGLTSVELRGCKGITSLAPLKALPNLKKVMVSKGAFSEAELSGFAQNVKVEQR